jgi:hypothetical protein
MANIDEKYDFTVDCGSFDHSAYLTGDEIEHIGNPTSVQDIPNGVAFKRSVLGMHQLITEAGLWRRLDAKNLISYVIKGPKLGVAGHSDATFFFAWGQMQSITKHGWEAWVAKWEERRGDAAAQHLIAGGFIDVDISVLKDAMTRVVVPTTKRHITDVEPPIQMGRTRQI